MWAVFVFLVATVSCRSDIPEEDILDDLFYSYNKHARPSTGPFHSVSVSHSLTFERIVSMEKHVLTADTWQMMKWQDSRLTWDPHDYSQVDHINIPDELVWTPDIILYNNAAATSGKTYASIRVVVDKDGQAVWIPGTRVTAYCEQVTSSDRANISAGDYKCPLKFGSWTYHEKSLNMTIDDEGLLMGDYIESPQYDVIDHEVNRENLYYACCPDPYTSVTYTLWLRRKCVQNVVQADVCEADSSTDTDTSDDDDDNDSQTDSSNTNDDDSGTDDNSDTSDDDSDDDTDDNNNNNGTNSNDDTKSDSSNSDENDNSDDSDADDNTDTSDDNSDDDNNDSNSEDDSESEQDTNTSNQTSNNQGVSPVVKS